MPAPGPNAPLRPPSKCSRCQANRVAWAYPRVDFCYSCLPGGPFTPPPCRRCGTTTNYFSQGMCGICHPGSPQHPDSCKGCLAWGVYRRYNWTCWSCRWWHSHYPEGVCDYCARTARLGEQGACRLCLEQARMHQQPGRALDLSVARRGQQLFFANMLFQRPKTPRLKPNRRRSREPWRSKYKNYLPFDPGTGFDEHAGLQLTLFDIAPDPQAVRERVLVEDSELTRYCAAIVNEHASQFGWSVRQRNDVIRSLRLLQMLRSTPNAKIRASDVLQLPRYDGNITSTIDVRAAADLLIDDRPSRVEHYFASKTSDLPPVMRKQLEVWLDVLTQGATRAPRQRARDPQTVRLHIMGIAPIIHAWAKAGHQSLAEITPEQILKALPAERGRRYIAHTGFRSLFKTLKARKLIFANPMRGLPSTNPGTNIPLPLDAAFIRERLNSPDPVVALAVALIAFHALTKLQLRQLRLTDITDGRLHVGDRSIPLAAPVRIRVAAWLDYRAKRWPNTANPHLIINRRTAPRLTPVGATYPWRQAKLSPQLLREDRILSEIHATGGDVRRICDLFGLSIAGATRYLGAVEHPGLTIEGERVRRT
jgi:hypothetical protein